MKELAKTYDPKAMEDRIYGEWLEKKYFHAEVDRRTLRCCISGDGRDA